MSDPTDLSKLSSDEIIGKIAELAVAYDGVWIIESIAKLHVLTVVLKQAVIREASVGYVCIRSDNKHETHMVAYSRDCGLIGDRGVDNGDYDLIPKETP